MYTLASSSLDIPNTQRNNYAFSQIRKESLDLYNRLHSIEKDIHFVNQVHDAYPQFPLIPNLRCGAWYTDPAIVQDQPGAYFKSTDGHTSNWTFNLRRPNLHLLPLIVTHDGIVLVDSTRSGKRIPDALSKTVPIWCAVVNRAIRLRYPNKVDNWDIALYTPPTVVSKNEHNEIENLLDNWAKDLQESSYSLPELQRPLRPIWLTPASSGFPHFSNNSQPFIPVVCVSASECIEEGTDRRSGGYVYIQGSGDDHELWGMGLTPNIFWRDRDAILSADRSEIVTIVTTRVVDAKNKEGVARKPTGIRKVGQRLLVCSISDLADKGGPSHICSEADMAFLIIATRREEGTIVEDPRVLSLVTPEGKKGHVHFLQHIVPQALAFIGRQLTQGARVCVACDDGKDLSVGITVIALQRFFDDEGNFIGSSTRNLGACIRPFRKTIRKLLEWIIADRPEANPSRSTLKRVNEFLMSPAFVPPILDY
ncbi:initiator tRNA phosphoribosyl transferase [Dendrothele bispora CBS 962.96]|uniref:Initiator tRNA phosphoribosyl transferase n=1 Tax=Dendrothele bispora (strain CBS 962.96) TaxID=1314807 RepID=A0A4S8MUT4_DENBC|nr:initiator tRNA phosphoribosyl transferase [Dendrothele bispora CBS 962.96]